MTRSVRIFVTFILALIPLIGSAQVNRIENILDSRARRGLDQLSDQLKMTVFPVPDKEAVVMCGVNAIGTKILVIGRAGSDGERYAQVLDRWSKKNKLPGKVEWGNEEAYSAARLIIGGPKRGQMNARFTFDVDSLKDQLQTVEPKVTFLLGESAWCPLDVKRSADGVSKAGVRIWILRPEEKVGMVTAQVTLSPILMPLLIAWFAVPFIGIFGAFGLGIAIAKNEKLPVARRRFLYGKCVLGGTYGVLAVHGVIAALTLSTRMLEPLTQVWFGKRFVEIAIIAFPISIFVPLLSFGFLSKAEVKLLGPTPEEAELQTTASKLTIRANPNPVSPWRGRLSLFGNLLFVGALLVTGNDRLRYSIMAAGLAFNVLSLFFRNSSPSSGAVWDLSFDQEATLQARLANSVDRVSAQMNVSGIEAKVLNEPLYGRFSAIAKGKTVSVSPDALELLSDEELDFVVAHELAHIKLGHMRKVRRLLFVGLGLMFMPFLLIILGFRATFVSPSVVLSPMMVSIVLYIPLLIFINRLRRANEFEADRLAVQTTGQASAAISALRKMTLNSDAPGVHDADMSTHPNIQARLKAISEM